MEVNLPTGCTFEQDKLLDLNSMEKVMKYDADATGSQLKIYYMSLNWDKSCVSLHAIHSLHVCNEDKEASSYVRVYDYYDANRTGEAFYVAPAACIA